MVIDLLKIVIPSLLVFLAGYFALSTLIKEETNKRKGELSLNNQRITLPVRLQAYERIILFLERIAPESLLVRVNKPGMTVQAFQSKLIISIRSEWEHNLSQQLYVSNRAWELTKNSMSNVIKLISVSAEQVKPGDPSIALSKTVLESLVEVDQHPTTKAVDFLKKEVKDLF